MEEKDRTLEEKDRTLAEKDRTLAEKDRTLAEKDRTLAEKDRTLAEKTAKSERTIASLAAELEVVISELQRSSQQFEAEIDNLGNTVKEFTHRDEERVARLARFGCGDYDGKLPTVLPGYALFSRGSGRRCDASRVTTAVLLRRRYLTLSGIWPKILMLRRRTWTPCCTTSVMELPKVGFRGRILFRRISCRESRRRIGRG